eukprot:gene2616-3241_t
MSSSEQESGPSSSDGEDVKKRKTTPKKAKKDTKVKKSKKETKKKGKKKKEEGAPRRYLSPFIFFSKEHRPSVKNENPNSTFGEIGSILGQKWNSINAEEKKKYEKLAAEDKKRWEMEKKDFDEKKKNEPQFLFP